MTLTEFESQSALWQKVSAHLTERLATLRERNDGNLDSSETARLRGTIAAIKEILALGTPTPTIDRDS